MEPKELAEKFRDAFESGDMETCLSCLSDDFQFSGPVPEPQNREAWMGTTKMLAKAFPDINYNLKITGVEGNKVMSTSQLSGTHTGELDLTPMGFGLIPATGKSFSNPEEKGSLTIEGDKITKYEIAPSESGGLMGILAQLGIQPVSS